MTTNKLLALASAHGHRVASLPLRQNKAFAVEQNGRCYIVLATGLPASQEHELLAHEMGHCEYAGFYSINSGYETRSRIESRARRWAYQALIPLDELRAAIREGDAEIWQLAERFAVSPAFVAGCLKYYTEQMGEVL